VVIFLYKRFLMTFFSSKNREFVVITYSFFKKMTKICNQFLRKNNNIECHQLGHSFIANQPKHNHLNLKNFTGSFRIIYCQAHLQAETQFHDTAKVQSMYVVAGQAILRLPVEMLSNYGYNVGWWLPDSLIQNKRYI